MKTLEEVTTELAGIKDRMRQLTARRSELERERGTLESAAFIAANKITRNDVQMSSGDDIPFHGNVAAFGKWLAETNCRKRWCEWNGDIVLTAEVIAGTLKEYGPGRTSELE